MKICSAVLEVLRAYKWTDKATLICASQGCKWALKKKDYKGTVKCKIIT
jgi:hypothetical protein